MIYLSTSEMRLARYCGSIERNASLALTCVRAHGATKMRRKHAPSRSRPSASEIKIVKTTMAEVIWPAIAYHSPLRWKPTYAYIISAPASELVTWKIASLMQSESER